MSNQVALVTGASRGIGKAILHALGAQGFDVVGTATTTAGAQGIDAALKQANLSGKGMQLDVTQPDSVSALLKEVKDSYAAPGVLVNNAGITRDNLLVRMKDEEWDAVINTNLSSVYRLTRACLRDMMKVRSGRIINITSVAAMSGNPGQSNYTASKAGIIGFTKSLAREVASRGITVNAIAPGFIETDMTGELNESQRTHAIAQIPAGHMGAPEDIAQAACFLVSAGAAYITGETIHVNGGMYMG